MREYRTFVVVLAGIAAIVWCAVHGVKGEDLVAVKWGVVGLAATQAGRAIGTAAAGGGGLGGIAKVLTTDAKPDPSVQP